MNYLRFLPRKCRMGLGLVLFCTTAGYGQTKIDLPSQAQNPDFSQAQATKPMKTGTVLPATCGVGELFYKTNATAGNNIYGCTASNTWTIEGDGNSGGGGGGTGPSSAADLTDLRLSFSTNTWTIAAGKVAFGSVTTAFNAATFAEADPNDTGTIYFCADYNAGSPRLLAVIPVVFDENNYTANGLVPLDGTACPGDSIQIGTGEMSSGTGSLGEDSRALFSFGPVLQTGSGLVKATTDAGQSRTLSVDTTVVGRYFSGSGAPGIVSGSRIGSLYFRTDTNQVYACFQLASDCTTEAPGNWVALN